jgi:hypothetical protein
MIDASRSRVVPRIVMRSWLAGALTATVAVGALVATPQTASAAAPVALGTAANFAVLAGKGIVNTGSTVVTGDLGVSPGSAVTGFPPGTKSGTTHAADAVAAQAQADLTTAYNDAAAQTPATTVPTQLGGTTVGPGIYKSTAGTFQITGDLTLDAQGDPDAVFIFQTTSSLGTGTASTVTLTGGAQECNVFWKVGSSAALGTNSSFTGNILALNSISAGTGAIVMGRTLARTGLVTLNKNTITPSVCQGPSGTTQAPPSALQAPPSALQASPCIPGQESLLAFTMPLSILSTVVPPGSVAYFATGPILGATQPDATGQAIPTATNPCEGMGQVAAAPGAGAPGAGAPGAGAPGTGTPGTSTPGTSTPSTSTPSTSTPGTGTPSAPSSAISGTGTPGTATPGMGMGMGEPAPGTSPGLTQGVGLYDSCLPWGC